MYHTGNSVRAFIEASAPAPSLDIFHEYIRYDLYVLAFGIRNVSSIPDVVREAHRFLNRDGLNPGGTFACLEFNQVTNPLLAQYVFSPPLPSQALLLGLSPDLWVNSGFMTTAVLPLDARVVPGPNTSWSRLDASQAKETLFG